jgi:tRNA(Ile2) C34 agmatinyltransferase TiaS
MILHRKCPTCKKDWYSGNTNDWVCPCGTVLDDKHNKPIREGDDERRELD